MTRRFLIPLAALALVASACGTLQVAAATVNGAKISESEVESELARVRADPQYQDFFARDADRGEARRAILNGLIRQEILVQEARSLGIEPTAAQKERVIAQVAAQFGLSVDEFLALQNLSRADAEELAGRIVSEQELSSRLVGSLDVADEIVERFYEQNRAAFEEAHLMRITVATEEEARRVLERLGRASFANVARSDSTDNLASEGGDMGYVPLAELAPEAQAAVQQVAEGRVTDPVPAQAGFEMYRVVDRRTRSLQAVEDQIRAELGRQTQAARFEEWVTEQLREADIVVNPKYGRFDPEQSAVVAGTGELRP